MIKNYRLIQAVGFWRLSKNLMHIDFDVEKCYDYRRVLKRKYHKSDVNWIKNRNLNWLMHGINDIGARRGWKV